MLSFSATACLLYLIKTGLSRTFFHFFERFSFNRLCPICYLKRDNSDILSCVVLFVNNFFILFWKFFQNEVVRCKIMSHLAVSLTIISSVSFSVNSFFIFFHQKNLQPDSNAFIHLNQAVITSLLFTSVSHPSHLLLI